MLFLGIDSSTMVGSVALLSDENLIGEYTLNLKRTHSERLMVAVEQLLGTSGVELADIDAICVAVGPGSYTGVRIGVTTAKALAWSRGKPLVAVNTLEAMAWLVPAHIADAVVAPCIGAKATLVFAAAYDVARAHSVIIGPEPVEVGSLACRLVELDRLVIPVGDGFYQHEVAFDALRDAGHLLRLPAHAALPRASLVAEVGRGKLARGETANPLTLAPVYLRAPEAEVAWARKHEQPYDLRV